ncbi:questin oxidase family protein [Aspergillus aculeatinus CBS 121060]|uniref:HypA-like protein n=1 Tax=Aspergillus aculeatinus CBS 121060 TaxID=1448322 RepID=A0ACD1HH23_9EURO|nr:hypA-like protein [Aspergillus aculeatinus CBS 121060]RAH72929.1 hypA-like protein [Aspergillus aculeatinus CBS 121060]
MATSTKIYLTPENRGVFSSSGLSWASARKVSEVLQHDMENHHIYRNDIEFHNHLVHFMLTSWALGASPETIELQYKREAKCQRPAFPRDEASIQSFADKKEFMKHMYHEDQYSNYLAFFQRVIAEKGVAAVVNEYLFGGDELAESLLSRLFAGLVHPIIHLGFGIEFQQPAIVAQALAQASVHQDYLGGDFYKPAAAAAAGAPTPTKTLMEIMDEMRASQTLREAAVHGDSEVFADGILKRAGAEVIRACSQWTVPEDKIRERLVEMINTAIYWTATAQHPQKQLKLDFFFIHAVNLAIFFQAFTDLPYLSPANKARLLEMKGRTDLLIWASRKMPEPQPRDVLEYPIHMGWPEIFAQSYLHPSDDGHLSKFVRTVAAAEQLCRPQESTWDLPVRGDMWLQIGNMAVDSVGIVSEDMWVRGSGFEESWQKFRPRT